MNSADPISYASDGHDKCSSKSCSTKNCPVDTSMQGAEIQDSPRGGSVNSSSSSLSPIRVEASTPQGLPVSSSQFTTTCAAPIAGHQLLVDPITGQHYLVSSGAQTHPQLIYQPVYYAPTPAPPVFYQSFAPTPQGALLMPSLSGGQHSVSSLVHPTAVGQRLPLAPSIVSSKLSSGGGDASLATDSSNGRFKNSIEEWQYRRVYDENEMLSPPMSPSYQEKSQVYKSLKASLLKSYISSNREVRRPSPLLNMPGSEISDQGVSKEQRTPLFGASPAWWGDEKLETRAGSENSFTEKQSTPRNRGTTEVVSKAVVLERGMDVHKTIEQKGDPSIPITQKKKPIRMDIDFSKPFDDDGRTKEEKPAAILRAPPTSFTVSFDNGDSGSVKEKLSLQDAAKRSTSRRLLRRSAPAATGAAKSPVDNHSKKILAETADPKQYLFKKMLMGDAVSNEGFSGAPEFVTSAAGPEKRDVDVISEAGTYVVDEKDRVLDPMASSQCIEESSNDSDSSESTTATTSSTTDQTPPSYAPIRITDNASGGIAESSSIEKKIYTSRATAQQNKGRRETQKLYDPKFRKNLAAIEQKSSTNCCASAVISRICTSNSSSGRGARLPGISLALETNTSGNAKRVDPALPSSPRRWGTSSNAVSSDNVTKVRNVRNDGVGLKNDTNQIRRVDGGRFSMRTASSGRTPNQIAGNNSQQTSRTSKPPFRSGGKGTNPQRESAEMAAWLRRKDYNPMKAAAEARKLQQLKSRSDQFTANRSISFHQGSAPLQSKAPLGNNLTRSRHNKSQDDLCDENSCGSRVVLATYSKGVTENLNRLKLAEENADSSVEANGVQKAVEQLAMKCYRSIDLIRSTHQGRLPGSVEDLLDRATQAASGTDNSVAEQVSRLSAAFDAIQKYLEVSSCASPTPSSTNSGRTSPSQHAEVTTSEPSVP